MRRWPGHSFESAILAAVVAACTVLAAWLRLHGLADQVVLDDEWHALAKLMSASYREIAVSFGQADHSIPLTLLDKALAATIGLDEWRLRGLQVAFGTALVPFAAWLAWRVTDDRPAAALLALTLAASPFLVLYSRIARPYAITTFLVCAVLALAWRWRSSPRVGLAAAACALGSLSAWLHPLTALYPATACLFIAIESLAASPDRAARMRRALALGIAMAAAMALPLLPPVLADFHSISGKAGTVHATLGTVARMLAIFSGVLPAALSVALVALAAAGAFLLQRRQPALGRYLLAIVVVPPAAVAIIGADWSSQGHTFARYVFPLQVVLLGWACFGAAQLARRLVPRHAEAAAWCGAVVLAVGYLAAAPTWRQVTRLGAWYSHIYWQYDFDPAYNRARTVFRQQPVPAFYRDLARLPPRSVLVVEAPFSFEAPYNPFAWFDDVGGQRAIAGLLGPLCTAGAREIPAHDPRFRFHSFVFLDDPAAVRAAGARYIALHLEQVDGHAFADAARCVDALSRRYGPPASRDARMATWDLAPR